MDVIIDKIGTNIADSTRIEYEFYLEYNDTGGGPFTLSVPINSPFLEEEEESAFNLTIMLLNDLEIEIGKTDKEIRPFVFQNKSGLSIGRPELEKLEDRRYELEVIGEEEDGDGTMTYVVIAVVSVMIAVIIFFLYYNQKYRSAVKKDEELQDDGSAKKPPKKEDAPAEKKEKRIKTGRKGKKK